MFSLIRLLETGDRLNTESITSNEVIKLAESAAFLLSHPKTLKKMATLGQIPSRRIGSHWRFSRTVLTKWMHIVVFCDVAHFMY